VRGQTQEAAIAAIQAAGLVPQIEEVPVTDPAAANIVSQQNPAPGARAARGADVAIVVGRLATAEDTG
jgi:beta-lactam-binding protein with PASTA domain